MNMQAASVAITALARQPTRGFTLIEMLVTVAIAAIVVSIALPVYQDSVRKGRRADAFTAIAAVQQAQERLRSNNPAYSTASTATELSTRFSVNEPTLYSITVSAPASPATLANGYVVTAVGRNAQASETQCKKLSLLMVDGNISYAACESCSTFTYTATNACWSR